MQNLFRINTRMPMNTRGELVWSQIAGWVIILVVVLILLFLIMGQLRADGGGVMSQFMESFLGLLGFAR